MHSNDFAQPDFTVLVTVFAAGLGMLLGGAANLVFGRFGITARVAAAAGTCVVTGVGAWVVAGTDSSGWLAAGAAATGMVIAGVGPTLAFVIARRPGTRWGALAGTGFLVAVGSVACFEYHYEAAADRALESLSALTEKPATRPIATRVATDRGTVVQVLEATDPRARAEMAAIEDRFLDSDSVRNRVIRRQPADDRSNCHGWVFTGGRYWVSGVEVDQILDDNGYAQVTVPQPGDLVVYRTAGVVTHTGVVRYVTSGMPVLVEGKWGTTGVYLHEVGASVYGAEFDYYRADRATHVLAGLDTTPATAGGQ
ncbi:MFS transporter [Urbifossiella limnaea]|uniref:Uncharacterized protein n=1 Tax=Urbifossiella limnaea TaxID=2528023 RepID=A0A517XZ44_9BACT|nr:MFS transporter [Urbifossiella limnaea]QDU22785.1 hypothetical protein ETAA1_47730 [Urbifossiella limnaea]